MNIFFLIPVILTSISMTLRDRASKAVQSVVKYPFVEGEEILIEYLTTGYYDNVYKGKSQSIDAVYANVDGEDGNLVKYAFPYTMIVDHCKVLDQGSLVKVRYHGLIESKAGTKYHHFSFIDFEELDEPDAETVS